MDSTDQSERAKPGHSADTPDAPRLPKVRSSGPRPNPCISINACNESHPPGLNSYRHETQAGS